MILKSPPQIESCGKILDLLRRRDILDFQMILFFFFRSSFVFKIPVLDNLDTFVYLSSFSMIT